MFHISKGMVGAAVLIAFGLVTVEDMAGGWTLSFARSQNAVADKTVVESAVLRERAAAALRTLTDRQEANRANLQSAARMRCRDQSWPYYAGDCLVRSDGRSVPAAVRVVRAEGIIGR